MAKDPITKKARQLQTALTNFFLSDAPPYSWCRDRVVKLQPQPWQDFDTFCQEAVAAWKATIQ